MKCRICKRGEDKVTFSVSERTGQYKKHCDTCDVRVRKYSKKYKAYNNKKAKEWRENNRERDAATQKRNYERRKEEIREYKRGHYQQNKETISKKQSEYYQANKEKLRPARSRLKQIRRGCKPLTIDDFRYVYNLYDNRCVYCGNAGNTLEHILPISRGGDNDLDNLAIACIGCNCSKGKRTIGEWWTFEREEMYGSFFLRLKENIDLEKVFA